MAHCCIALASARGVDTAASAFFAREAIALHPAGTAEQGLSTIIAVHLGNCVSSSDQRLQVPGRKLQALEMFSKARGFSPVVGLLHGRLVTEAGADDVANQILYDWMSDNRKAMAAADPDARLFGSPAMVATAARSLVLEPERFRNPWGVCIISASLVPSAFDDGQWLSLSVQSKIVRSPLFTTAGELNGARTFCADPHGIGEAVDAMASPTVSVSRGGTRIAVARTQAEIQKLLADLELRGLLATSLVVAAGLFGIWDDIERGGTALVLPAYTEIVRAPNHVDRDKRIARGESVHDAGQDPKDPLGTVVAGAANLSALLQMMMPVGLGAGGMGGPMGGPPRP